MRNSTDFTLWGNTSQRWGHKLHSMCSYLGTFPPSLARYFISMLSSEGDIVMDPFSGRGTVHLESRLCNRFPISSDLNPIAIALSKAKNQSVSAFRLLDRINELEFSYDQVTYLNEAAAENEEIKLIFDQRTLAQLCYLKRKVVEKNNPIDNFLVGTILGILHGKERKDGTSAYASISMPNTFSMSPTYVRKFVASKQLNRTFRNVFKILRERVKSFQIDPFPSSNEGIVINQDARTLSSSNDLVEYLGKVKLILTSPPYLGIVNYARQNWIRTWFLNTNVEEISGDLDDNLTLDNWKRFMKESLGEMDKLISDDGIIVLVIGDVVKSNKSAISLAREFLREVIHEDTYQFVGLINDRIKSDEKTTRIWSDTKGKATETDRIVLLSNSEPQFHFEDLINEFDININDFSSLDIENLKKNAKILAGI